MRTGSSDTLFQGHRGRTRRDARLKSGRKSRFRRLDLEGLENRLLLATAPAAVDTTVNGSALGPISLTNLTLATEQGDANSPTVAVDPYDSQKVFAVWGLDGSQIVPAVTAPTAVVEGAYSDDGGADWTSLGVNVNPPMTDPLTLTSYEQITDPSVAFDSQGNVYVLALQSSGATDGALTLTKFNFSGTSPNSVGLPNNGIIYQWITGADAATTPTLAVDAGTFPSGQTPPAGVPTDPYVNNVYIAWASIDGEPAAGAVVFNPDRIEIVVGTPVPGASGNQSTMAFSGVRTVNTGGNFTTQIDTHPQLIINPGNSGDPGQITVGWEDAGTADAANGGNPPLTLLMSNIVQPGKAYGFISGSIGAIAPAQSLTINGTTVTVPVTTPFSDSVSVPNPASINDLTVTLAATDQQSIGNLQVVLEAPNGAEITLVENQINAAAQANTSVGLPTGNAIGVYGFTTGATGNPGQVVGTTFDDNATRNIFDPTNAIPPVNGNTAVDYVGFFRPEFGSLKNFLTSVGSANINNSWTLLITNYSPTITAGVANQATLSAFSLQFSTRMTTPAGVSPSSIANEFEYYYGTNTAPFFTIVVPGSLTDTYPTTAPSTPNGVGPGLVFAEDNTLGPYSPYQGRIYAAFVGYFDAAISGPTNPTTNTDIFLVYSDNGGQTWSSPELVNADQASTDGYSAANDSEADPNNELTGRTQFQPELAVDQSTGTLVISWRDARDDAGNARVATYITTSIDGGQTFGPATYANPPKTAVDAITGATNIIGPASDNESAGNPATDALFGYGNQMGLAVAGGQLFPIWAGNFNGPNGDTNDSYYNGAVTSYPLNIWYQPMTIAAGPRIISTTTGPVVATTLTGSAVDLPQFIPPTFPVSVPYEGVSGPGVLDSQVVIPASGNPGTVDSSLEVELRITNPNDSKLSAVLIAPDGTPVTLFAAGTLAGANLTNTIFSDGAAHLITAGTAPYTGTFKPEDPLGLAQLIGKNLAGTWTLQITNDAIYAAGGEVNLVSWSLKTSTATYLAQSGPTTSTIPITGDPSLNVGSLQVTLSLVYPTDGALTLKLIAPATNNVNFTGTLTQGSASVTGVSSTVGLVVGQTVTGLGLPFGTTILTINSSTDTLMLSADAAVGGSKSLTASYSVTLYQKPGDTGQSFTNTTFSDSAAQSITAGTAPYTGTFQPVQSLSLFNGLPAGGNWMLEVDGGTGPNGGILQSWSLSVNGVASKPTSFDVTFDRPIDPLALINAGQATFSAADVQVFYHDTTSGDASIPLMVTGVTAIQPAYYVTDPTQDGYDGYTNFLVTFNPDELPTGKPSGITDYTGTYSYVIAPDNGAATPTAISSPIWSYATVPQPEPVITPVKITPTPPGGEIVDPKASVSPNLSIPTWGPGGSGTQYDQTTSTITLSAYNNETINGLTVNLTITDPLTPPGLGNDGDLELELTAPNGNTIVLYEKPGDTNQNLTNVTFSNSAAQSILLASGPYTNGTYQPNNPLTLLNGSAVNGVYVLTIDNFSNINAGTLVNWSITIHPTTFGVKFQSGAAMDQNADGTSDENPLTAPFIGLSPGDLYEAPMPQPTAPITFNATNLLNPPFDQNTLPLIFPGPYVVSTSVPGGTGYDNEVLNGTNSSLNVTFDEPMETSSFAPGNVLQIMGPVGSITGPQSYPSDSTLQTIQTAPSATEPYVLDSTLTIPSFDGTFTIEDITLQLNIAFSHDASLSAVLIAPDGTQVALFSGVGGLTGANFVNTTFDDAAETAITSGAAPFTGTFQPTGKLSSLDGKTVDAQNATISTLYGPGVWTLQVTNSSTTIKGTLEGWSLNITPMLTVTGLASGTFTGTLLNNSATVTGIGSTAGLFAGQSITGTGIPYGTTIQAIDSSTSITLSANATVSGSETLTSLIATAAATTVFRIGFPQQELSGTYTLEIGENPATGLFPLDTNGDAVDSSFDAGLDVLRGGGSNTPVTTVGYAAADLPKVIPAPTVGSTPSQVTSTIIVPNNFQVLGDTTSSGISGLRVTVNLTYPYDPDLTLTLEHFDLNGNPQGSIALATSVGAGGNQKANFTNTVFDDNATTPIQNAGAPFFGTYNPQLPLSDFAGVSAQGTWVLVVQNNSTTNGTGTINSWSLSFQKPVPTSGLGEPGADNISASFRIFNLGQADAMSAEAWTPVGPASNSGTAGPSNGASAASNTSGSVTALAIDPSDPTGNTVYAAGASGGVWKTTDFLTTNPAGPTWISLTSFGPSNAVNIGSITVFPRNGDTNQSIIIAATGENDTTPAMPGVGFLISTDGGATWALDDSSVNVDSSGNPLPIETTNPLLARNRVFVGDTIYQVVVDPTPSPSGGVIIYAAVSGPSGGIWRSQDTGAHWTNMLPGQATAVVLDQDSAAVQYPAGSPAIKGNLQVVYAGIEGTGVEMSPNQGQFWSVMSGGVGNPLIVNTLTDANVNPIAPALTPNGAQGQIVLAVPDATGESAEDPIYEGWLYAAVAGTGGAWDGMWVTKDFGQNWTSVRIPTLTQTIPTNDVNFADYSVTGGGQFNKEGNNAIVLTVDPTNPNIVYVGGGAAPGTTGLVRVDTTNIWDAHSLVPYSNFSNDGGLVNLTSIGPASINEYFEGTPYPYFLAYGEFPDTTPYENFIRSPDAPFVGNATLDVFDYSDFTNNGAGVTWIPFDPTGNPAGTDYHAVAVMTDPLTGLPRLILGNSQGVWTILDNNGTFETQVGASSSGVQLGSPTAQLAGLDRNGNLQITQFYYGAVQPSSVAAQLAGALFYGSSQDNGGPVSDPNIISNGNLTWSGPTLDANTGDAAGVATDQQGSGSAYQFFWPCCAGNDTDFFQYIGPGLSGAGLSPGGQVFGGYVGRTFGLLQASGGLPTPDPQWPYAAGANFAVDPVNSADVVISSNAGRVFVTQNSGVTWFDVGDPGDFGNPGSFDLALAYGAPDPSAPEGLGTLGNFIYVGTQTGQIYVTQDGGGNGAGNNWIKISAGLPANQAIESIVTDPIRGSHDAYAVTSGGVFYMPDSIPSGSNPTPTWVNITGNIHDLAYSIFGQTYDPTQDTANSTTLNQALTLSSIVADWRYQIPFDPTDLSKGYHPVLYVSSGSPGSNGSGVYQSLDNGTTWTLFPDTTYGAVAAGGDLPHVSVTDLDVSLGNVNANTGMPVLAGPDQAIVFTGTLTLGSASVTGINNLAGLALGDTVEGNGIPAGTTIGAINTSAKTITLSYPAGMTATASGLQTLAAADPTVTPDPDLLLATTYGQGQFAINLAPLIVGNAVTVTQPTNPGTGANGLPIVEGPFTIAGSSEISGFGNTTWITIEDVTNPAAPTVIGGFNPANGVPVPSASNSTDSEGNFSININPAAVFANDHGVKTIEIFATDGAGSVGNKVTYTFDLNPATQLVFAANGEPPMSATAGANFAGPLPVSPVVVDAEDIQGNIDPFYEGPVTLSLAIGANGTFPVTVDAINGVATFNTLAIDTAGTYMLSATSGALTPGTSTSITISAAAPDQLVWTTQPPSEITVNNVFGTIPTIEVEDQFGNQEFGYTQNVSLALQLNGTGATGDLNGPGGPGSQTVQAVNGVAMFPGLSITAVGSLYNLVATSQTPMPNSVTLTSPSTGIEVVAPVLKVTSQPATPVTAGTPFQLVVTAYTYLGAVDTAFNDTLVLSVSSGPNPPMNNLPISATASNGVATFSALTSNPVILDTAGPYILQASDSTLNLTVDTSTITVVAAGVDGLVFLQGPPASVYARSEVGFGVVVGAEDQFGNPTTLSGSVTLQIASAPPGGGALDGMTTVTAAGGVATFSGLSISVAGSPYTLMATSGTHSSPPSSPIDVLPAPATSLQVTLQPPSSVMVYQNFSITVQAYDQFGQFDPDFNGSVTVAVATGPGTLYGTVTLTAVNGVAAFTNDLYLTTVANGYTLSVSSPGVATGATTNAFNVTAAPANHLIILSEPVTSVTAGTAFGFVVEAEDQYNNLATSFNGTVTAALASGPTGGTLGGSLMVNASGGVAIFSALVIDQAGGPYILSASNNSLTVPTVNTSAVTVTPAAASQLVVSVAFAGTLSIGSASVTGISSLVGLAVGNSVTGTGIPAGTTIQAISTANDTITLLYPMGMTATASGLQTLAASAGPPASVTAGSLFGLTVTAEDLYGNVATTYNSPVSLSLATNPTTTGTLGGILTATASQGQAVFTTLQLDIAASGYTIKAQSGKLTPAITGPITVTPAAAYALSVSIPPPSTMTSGSLFGLQISALDQYGNLATGFTGTVTIALYDPPAGAMLTGPLVAQATAGVANFHAAISTETAATYTLQATSPNLTSVLTPGIMVIPAPATQLVIMPGSPATTPPTTVSPGQKFSVVVDAEDQYGNVNPNFTGMVSIAVASGSSTLGGTTPVAAVNGVATFNNLTLTQSSSPVTLQVTSVGVTPALTPATISISVSNPPTSNVAALPATTTTASFTVSWSGSDGQGPGIASYNIYVSDNAGAYTLWQAGTTKTSATYTGQVGHTYGFYSVATDLLGLVQPTPASAQATTKVALTQPPLPLVTMTNVQDKTNSKHQVTEIIVTFSGAVNMTEAQSAATYELVAANTSGSFTGKGVKVIKVKSAAYNATAHTVTLTPAAFTLSKSVELVVYGSGTNGLKDSKSRYIDGNHDGVAGGNAVAILKKGGVTIDAVPAGPLATKAQRKNK